MVIKGSARGDAAGLAAHLLRTDTNEEIDVLELRGVAANDLRGALDDMELVGSGTRSKRPLYHASLNTAPGEQLSEAQRARALDRLEQELGFTGQPRAVVKHSKAGRVHYHIVWSRIDLERMAAIPDSHNYRRHEIVARELEREFGHERVQGAHVEREGPGGERVPRPDRTPSHAEMQQAERSKITPQEARRQITDIWNRTDSGRAFAAALEGTSWILARGDDRDFVLIDAAAHPHSLAKRVEGARAKDVRARMSDLDPASLPSVREAKLLQYDRANQLKAVVMSDTATPTSPADDEARRLDAVRKEEEQKLEAVRTDEAQRREKLDAEALRTSEANARQLVAQAQEMEAIRLSAANAQQFVMQAHEMGALRDQAQRIEAWRAGLEREARETQKKEAWTAKQQREEAARPKDRPIFVNDAGARYGQALGANYDIRDPYGSLARAAMAEHGAFVRDREALNLQISKAADPAEREALELRKEIELRDYMMITSNRIATQSEIIVGRSNTDEAVKQRERAAAFQAEAKALREQLREQMAAREAGRVAGTKDAEPAPLMVIDKTRPDATPEPLKAHVEKVQGQPEPKTFSAAALAIDAENRRANTRQKVAEAERMEALHRMSGAMKDGKPLDAADVKTLRSRDIEGIKKDGDKHLRVIVQENEKQRSSQNEATHDRGRERER